ncbi:hypothetical protein OG787_45655 [Streptomyces sp. NBC_00075]|uniref:putative quinol monooxygenase n=1 Tax=Streptomyces sp. NBC_00075 TaxID=2975641 RepID=UPI00324C6A82
MIVLAGSFLIPAEKVTSAQPFFRFMVERTRAESKCVSCSYGTDVVVPGQINVALCFEDRDGLIAHRLAPYVTDDWNRFVKDFGVTEFDVDEFEAEIPKKADWTDA